MSNRKIINPKDLRTTQACDVVVGDVLPEGLVHTVTRYDDGNVFIGTFGVDLDTPFHATVVVLAQAPDVVTGIGER